MKERLDVSAMHRAAAQRELAQIFDAIAAEHQSQATGGYADLAHDARLTRIERALLLLRDELFNNPHRAG